MAVAPHRTLLSLSCDLARVSSPHSSRAPQPLLEVTAVHGATFARRAGTVTTGRGEDLRLHLAERHQLSVYDAMIVAAALSAGSDVLWTEDLHSGAVFEGMRVTNPFVPLTP